MNSTPPCRRSLHTDHQVLNLRLQLALLQVFDPRAAQRKPFTNLEPSSGLEDNSVESKSQKEKNYANPVPQGLGKIRLSKASTLCIAMLVLERTDAMASWMKWPVLWAPTDGHTCRCPLGASQHSHHHVLCKNTVPEMRRSVRNSFVPCGRRPVDSVPLLDKSSHFSPRENQSQQRISAMRQSKKNPA